MKFVVSTYLATIFRLFIGIIAKNKVTKSVPFFKRFENDPNLHSPSSPQFRGFLNLLLLINNFGPKYFLMPSATFDRLPFV